MLDITIPYTPDFGLSDLWNHYIPLKYLFFENLKSGRFLLWTDAVGNGFPIFAQGQVGVFYIVNLLLFGLLPFAWSLSLFYPVNILIGWLGMYLLLKQLSFSRQISIVSALAFCFSGFFIGHHTHWDIFQASLLLPWIILFYLKASRTKKITNWLIFSLALSQQMFLGNLQITLITITAIFVFIISQVKKITKQEMRPAGQKILKLLFGITLAGLLSMIQLLPTAEFARQGFRAGGLPYEQTTAFPFTYKELVNFIYPFAFGNPAIGTYHELDAAKGIFWENSCFLGFFIPIMALFAFVNKKRAKYYRFAYLLFLVSILLVLGDNSPFYFLFSFFPLNYFRVPSRFLLLSIFSLVLLAAITAEFILNRKNRSSRLLITMIFLINFASQLAFVKMYVPLAPINQAVSQPAVVKNKVIDPAAKVYTLFVNEEWNKTFYRGWTNPVQFIEWQNSLMANINLLWGKKSGQIHNSLTLKKHYLLNNLIGSGILTDHKSNTIEIKKEAVIFLQSVGITDLVSARPIKNLDLNETVPLNENASELYFYRLNNPLPLFYLADNAVSAETTLDFGEKLKVLGDDFYHSVIYNQSDYQTLKDIKTSSDPVGNIDYAGCPKSRFFHSCYQLTAASQNPAVLIFNDLYYPGWQGEVNGVKTKIIPANLWQKSVLLPAGQNQIVFKYQPLTFIIGALVSVTAHLVLAAALKFFQRTAVNTPQT